MVIMYKVIEVGTLNKYGHMTEEEIQVENDLIQATRKDPGKFSAIYDKYFEGIFYFIFRRTDDEDVTADLCSQTFLKALQNIRKYEFRGLPFSAWLYRIASNEVNKYYYKKKKTMVFSLEEERVMELFEDSEKQFSQEQIDMLIKVLKELPTDTVEVLELRFFEGRSFKEIAFILNISESGAKMRLYRSVEKLRKHFTINWREEE
jgi:RNA polymerase sigma-70 factor, ECF subfamily